MSIPGTDDISTPCLLYTFRIAQPKIEEDAFFQGIVAQSAFDRRNARQTGAALASMLVYIAMAAILAFRPAGLFPVRA